jgi:hypothetical protein
VDLELFRLIASLFPNENNISDEILIGLLTLAMNKAKVLKTHEKEKKEMYVKHLRAALGRCKVNQRLLTDELFNEIKAFLIVNSLHDTRN